MKFVIVQGDGMADLTEPPARETTPLAAARTPHLDRIAGCGLYGLVRTIPAGYPPGSDVGNLSLFGYDPRLYYTGRSPLEAAAMGVKLGPEDIAFRMNTVALRRERGVEVMDDYSGGHIDTAEARELVLALNERLADESFQFYPGVSYRHLMVWRKGKQEMKTRGPHDIADQPIAPHLPQGPGAEQLRRLMDASRAILAAHPVNARRTASGSKAITQVWFWGQGKAPSMPAFRTLYGLRGACISAVDLVRGVAVYAGFDLIAVPGATGYLDTDYAAKGRYALDALRQYDLLFVHIEAPDEAGHMGNRQEKIRAIEAIDEKIIGPMLERLPACGDFRMLVTSDHATPVSMRTHTPDPVPFALATGAELEASRPPVKFAEAPARATGVVIEEGYSVIRRMQRYPG
ncbi:MAG: cofactor-independent phosphoglycerate mutase [Candidatus Lambdaproteobacteria bacterium]|nr:cofactor-independent phosphoglycerate mutase [Candidatus Lambdaproteobacteria bacterium]